MTVGVDSGVVTVGDGDTCGATAGTGVSTGVAVGGGARGVGPGVPVSLGLSAPGPDGLEVGVGVGRPVTFCGVSVDCGSPVAGTGVADSFSPPPGCADSVGSAIPPFSEHATITSNAIASTTVASLLSTGATNPESRFPPLIAGFHIVRPSHGGLALKRGVTPILAGRSNKRRTQCLLGLRARIFGQRRMYGGRGKDGGDVLIEYGPNRGYNLFGSRVDQRFECWRIGDIYLFRGHHLYWRL